MTQKTMQTPSKTLKEYIQKYFNDFIFEDFEEEDEELLLDEDPNDSDEDTLKSGEVEAKDIIEKLNTIRSGRSFKDSAVKGELEKYVDDLDIAEKTALFALLKGIAQIVTKEISAEDATEPTDPAPNVEMEKKASRKSIKIKPTVIKKSVPKEEKDSDELETPIVPK